MPVHIPLDFPSFYDLINREYVQGYNLDQMHLIHHDLLAYELQGRDRTIPREVIPNKYRHYFKLEDILDKYQDCLEHLSTLPTDHPLYHSLLETSLKDHGLYLIGPWEDRTYLIKRSRIKDPNNLDKPLPFFEFWSEIQSIAFWKKYTLDQKKAIYQEVLDFHQDQGLNISPTLIPRLYDPYLSWDHLSREFPHLDLSPEANKNVDLWQRGWKLMGPYEDGSYLLKRH